MGNEISTVFEATEERFLSIAPNSINFDSEKGFAIQALKNNGYLYKAASEHPESFQQAITNVAAIGLSLNPAEKLAYLIPRNVKDGDGQWRTKVFLEPSYMGIIRLATDSGSIKWVQAFCVYADDTFLDNGAGEKPTHQYDAFSAERGEFVGVYCVAKTHDNDYITTLMPVTEVHKIRQRSESFKKTGKGPWADDFNEMAKKAVIRRAFKTWPRTDERRMGILAEAVQISNENEGFEPIVSSPDLGSFTADQKEYFDQLITEHKAWDMYALSKSLDINVWISLSNSFEHGQKGKYKAVLTEMLDTGFALFESARVDLQTAFDNEDDNLLQETILDVPEAEIELLLLGLNAEVQLYVRGVM